MSATIHLLNEKIEAKHLLKHPFYRAWSAGELTLEDLQSYSRQYFAHVRAFPAYLSEMHSRCQDLNDRRVIAQNLADEEAGNPTHPELWLDFAAGLGVEKDSVLASQPGPKVAALIDTFRELARLDTPLAAAALYCYEKQIPTVAGAKIEGLKDNYQISDPSTLRYFSVHEEADVQHSAQWESLMERHAPDAGAVAAVADRALDALWGALDEIHASCGAACC